MTPAAANAAALREILSAMEWREAGEPQLERQCLENARALVGGSPNQQPWAPETTHSLWGRYPLVGPDPQLSEWRSYLRGTKAQCMEMMFAPNWAEGAQLRVLPGLDPPA